MSCIPECDRLGFRRLKIYKNALAPATVSYDIASDYRMVRPMPVWWPPAPESVQNAATAFRYFCQDLPLNPSLPWICRQDNALGYMLGDLRLPEANRHLVALARVYEAADAIAECRAEELRLGKRAGVVAKRLARSNYLFSPLRAVRREKLFNEAITLLETLRIESEAQKVARRRDVTAGDFIAIENAVRQLRNLLKYYSVPGPRQNVTINFFVRRLTEVYGLVTGLSPVYSDTRKLDSEQQFYKPPFIDYLCRAFAAVGLPEPNSYDHVLREFADYKTYLIQLFEWSPSDRFQVRYSYLPSTGGLIDYCLREFYKPGMFPPFRLRQNSSTVGALC